MTWRSLSGQIDLPGQVLLLTQILNLADCQDCFCCRLTVPPSLLSGDILQASDDLSHVITSYKKIVEGQTINGETAEAQQTVRQGLFEQFLTCCVYEKSNE